MPTSQLVEMVLVGSFTLKNCYFYLLKCGWFGLEMRPTHAVIHALVKIKQPAVAVEVDRRQPKVALESVIRLKLITDLTLNGQLDKTRCCICLYLSES